MARRRPRRPLLGLDDRTHVARPLRRVVNTVFPDHWSIAFGEIALYSFVMLLLSGTYLSFFYDPSDARVVYDGRYVPLDGVPMSKAFSSTMDISFDVRGGLLIRQLHHWAALLFFAMCILHLLWGFFTGAFRKPRELNWVIGVSIFLLSLLEGYSGYVLPDDVLSSASLHIAQAVVQSLPVVGTWLAFMINGGKFPGPLLLTRLYVAHALLIPAIMLALIGAHLALVVRQKHSQPWSPRAQEEVVRGDRVWPVYAAKAGGRFFITAGVLTGLGGLAQINPVFYYGPFQPADIQSNAQSDWYLFWLEGSLRIWPGWEIRAFHHEVPAIFFPGVILPALIFGLTAAYPWIEARFTHDRARHHVLQRPRDAPVRSGIGAAGFTFWVLLELSACDDMITHLFHLTIEAVVGFLRIGVIAIPPLVGLIVWSTCRRLARAEARDEPGARHQAPVERFLLREDGTWVQLEDEPSDRARADVDADVVGSAS